MPRLNLRQRKFQAEYIKTGNGKQSAINAGYSKRTAKSKASQLLSKVNLKNQIIETFDKSKVTPEFVLKELNEAMQSCKTTLDHSNWVKVAELFGKHLQMFSDKLVTDVNINVNVCNELQSLLGSKQNSYPNLIDITPKPELLTDNQQPDTGNQPASQ